MIQRALAFLREVRNAPIHPVTAGMGALCVVVGASVVQRYVLQQQQGLAQAWAQLQMLGAEAQRLQEAASDLRARTADPLGPTNPADGADDESLDELLAHEEAKL